MLKQYSRLNTAIQRYEDEQFFFEPRLNYLSSTLLYMLGIEDADEKVLSVYRACQVCVTLNIPLSHNFKRVYCFDGKDMIADWEISALGCYLIIINCNPVHENVAKAQLYFAVKKEAHRY